MQMAWKESTVMNEISLQILIEMKMRCIFNMCLIEYTRYEHPELTNKTIPSCRYIQAGTPPRKQMPINAPTLTILPCITMYIYI